MKDVKSEARLLIKLFSSFVLDAEFDLYTLSIFVST